jgi:hypothetical protein
MLSTEVFFTDESIFFKIAFDNSNFKASQYPVSQFSKTLKYSIKREILVYTDEQLKPESSQPRIGIEDKKYGIILGKVNYLKKKCIILTYGDKKLHEFENGVVYAIQQMVLVDCQTQQELNRELIVLNEFFESFGNKLCYYVPYNLSKMVNFLFFQPLK